MAEKSARRCSLELSLAEDPQDTFIRYALGVQCLREGDVDEGRQRLHALLADHPEDQVAAYQQLGQSYLETGEREAAAAILRIGISKARERGELHAAMEMEQLLSSMD
jgi:thioredoxin-like negative regulator of GroEL